jgi:hypothetical protein
LRSIDRSQGKPPARLSSRSALLMRCDLIDSLAKSQ